MDAEKQRDQEKDERIPMPVFTAGERFKESVYRIGDVTLFRPISMTEIFVGIPLCALFAYIVVLPFTSGTTAFAIFAVLAYMSPKALVWIEAKAGRPLVAEALASITFAYAKVTRQNIYQGVRQVSPYADRNQYKRVKAMLEAEDEAHAEIMAGRNRPGAD